jgi:hypothetical protein
MAWITPAADALVTEGVLMSAEFDRIKAVQLPDGSSAEDVLVLMRDRTIAMMRGFLQVRFKGSMGEPGTIPDELLSAMLALWCVDFLTRIGSAAKSFITPDRVTAKTDALALLARCADGKFAVVLPETTTTETASSGSGGAELIAAPCRPL